jgi:hypothetical protein
MLSKSMPVHENLHAAYWEARGISAKAIEVYRKAGTPPPYQYFLLDKRDELVGYGEFDAYDTADDMAWIVCMFLEMGLKTAFPIAPDTTTEELGASLKSLMQQTNAEDGRTNGEDR